MRMIPLTQGKFAKVDDADYEWLVRWRWLALISRGSWYARRSDCSNGKQKFVYMHRAIMQAPAGMDVDHVNHDGLDNRRSNLRLATTAQNMMNRKKHKNNNSGFIGVSFDKERGKYRAQVRVNGKKLYLGLFTDPADAARARDAVAKRIYGEFASLNFQDE